MESFKLALCFSFILFHIPFVLSHLNNASDQEALLGFKAALTSSNPSINSWKPNVYFCEWIGVICSRRRQRVVSINVSSMALEATISPLLGDLSFLRILDLLNNSFSGHIPYQLGNLFRLKTLRLSRNQLEGSIPPTLSGCRILQNLSLPYNNLTGNLPAELCVLPNLRWLNLGKNNLTGTIPACLANISSLAYVYLSANNFHGSVPSELGMLSHVSVMGLGDNHLTGQIPSSLSNCTNLQSLGIAFNQLTGHIPLELCSKNTQLMQLYLSQNQLTGSIPASLFNCTNFQLLDLTGNQISGVVPMELGKLTQLLVLSLGANQLVSGSTTSLPILTALTNCCVLNLIDLSYNNLKGCLSFSIGRLSIELQSLRLGENGLDGEIPWQIGNLTSLTLLVLENNIFRGTLPSSFIMLQNLERLYMGGNRLHGNILEEIGQLK